ncbi:MAG: hypothetical protein HRT77_00400 [Halioglobus sp.]|nr:hypothetical protein [Halioglobus sp.]
MSVGPEKGPLIAELAHRLPPRPKVLGLGAYCGYSSIVIADNVGTIFAPEHYLNYVRNCGHYDCEHRRATIEYTTVPDAVEISVCRSLQSEPTGHQAVPSDSSPAA